MVKTALVATELALGPRILEALDSAELSISVAMWLYPEEYEDWRFVLASRKLDAAGLPGAFRLVDDALEKAGIPYPHQPTWLILEMKDPFIRELRRTFAKAKYVEGMRLGLQNIGGRYVEDAFVYRIR